jgi:hypothetical protein
MDENSRNQMIGVKMDYKYEKFNEYAKRSAVACSVAGGLYIITPMLGTNPLPLSSALIHTITVLAMMITYNFAVVARTLYLANRPIKDNGAWQQMKFANAIAAIFLVVTLATFVISNVWDYFSLDGRVFFLLPMFLLQQLLRTFALKKL